MFPITEDKQRGNARRHDKVLATPISFFSRLLIFISIFESSLVFRLV